MYLSARNTESQFVKQAGGRVIVTARALDKCWRRFVYVKEIMHTFDDPDEATDSGEEFEALLEDLSGPVGSTVSPQLESEVKCFWMALGVLCPEAQRLDYADRKTRNEIDDFTIATQLDIPLAYVPRLFEPRYLMNIRSLISQAAAVARSG